MQLMVKESAAGAYLGPGPGLTAGAQTVRLGPNFDVFHRPGQCLILARCSRLADDEEPTAGRYGIDFHRALPPFDGDSRMTCDMGDGPVTVNAYNYACYLPYTMRFREFTANLAFAARTSEEYQAKSRVYQDFYQHLYHSPAQLIIAAPHSGEVRRRPSAFYPFPQAEIDAWTARVAVRCISSPLRGSHRLLLSLHSTDYFGTLMDVGDFGLPPNRVLPQVIDRLNERFAEELAPLLPAYRAYLIPYTRKRLEWFARKWGTLDPQDLAAASTAARFEITRLTRILQPFLPAGEPAGVSAIVAAMGQYCLSPPRPLVTLNAIFSGRKTARLLNLPDNLRQADFHTAVQVECSRFLARHHPDLAAALITALLQELEARL